MRYRKKPIVVEAVQWDGKLPTIEPLMAGSTTKEVGQDLLSDDLVIVTLEGDMTAKVGDWIIRGIKGELYPIKDGIFRETYEAVDAA